MVKIFDLFKFKKGLKGINKSELDKEILENKTFGLNTKFRERKLIVSLTSFPERMYDIHYCIYSLLSQSLKPDEVILWLASEQFPNGEKDIPENVLKLKDKGLTIKWCENLYSYKKLIPAYREFKNAILITTDDDIFYPPKWLETLYKSYLTHPNAVICHRAHRIKLDKGKKILPYKQWKKKISGPNLSYLNFFTGAGGVLYPPNSLNQNIDDIKQFTMLAPHGDDIWFWAMALLNNTKIYVAKNNIKSLTYINPERERGNTGEFTLFTQNKQGGNDTQLKQVLEAYPELYERIYRK